MIEPALSAEAWKRYPDVAVGSLPPGDELPLYYPSRHGIAAANLYGQPFGFTREDVRLLEWWGMEYEHTPILNLAARIAALLPPDA